MESIRKLILILILQTVYANDYPNENELISWINDCKDHFNATNLDYLLNVEKNLSPKNQCLYKNLLATKTQYPLENNYIKLLKIIQSTHSQKECRAKILQFIKEHSVWKDLSRAQKLKTIEYMSALSILSLNHHYYKVNCTLDINPDFITLLNKALT